MTKLTLALGSALALMPAVSVAQNVPAAIIAVVDTQRILGSCTACVAANTQIQTLVAQAQQRATALSGPLQTQEQSLQAEANRVRALPEGAAKTAAITALNQRVQAFQASQGTANQELDRLRQNIDSTRQNVLRQIGERMNPIVSQVMTQRGANIALDQQATLAAARGVDVTDAVLALLNQQLPSVTVAPLPQQAQPAARPAPTGR